MSRKISDFFIKKSIKIESSEATSVKLESDENLQNLAPNNNSGEKNQSRINENVKTEAEKQLLVILPQPTILKLPVPIKIEDNEQKVEQFKCQKCDKNYSRKSKFNTHVKYVHENPGSFKCEICNFGFNTKGNLKTHQITHNKNRPKPIKCSKCDFATDNKASLSRHLKTHERIIERCVICNKISRTRAHACRSDCSFCGKEFKNRGTVLNHIKKHHVHETKRSFYECDICGLKFYLKKSVKIHMNKKHADGKIQTFTCDLDGKTFKFKEEIVQHMKVHLPQVKCDFCHKKVNIRQLKVHIKNFHTGIKPPKKYFRKKLDLKIKKFQCPICFKILITAPNLERHIKEHNKTIKCKFCEKLFGNQSRLKEHIKDCHENPEGLSCEICRRKFTRRACLKSHMKIHDPNRSRDLKCSQCDYATDKKYDFKNHLNFHKTKNAKISAIINPHKCPKCPSILKSKKGLSQHMCKVHPKVLHECDICGKEIKVKGGLMQHFRGFHKIEL